MKFGRKSQPTAEAGEAEAGEATGAAEAAAAPTPAPADLGPGPHDAELLDPDGDGVERVDLGSLLISPTEGLELRLQVDEAAKTVQSVMVVGNEGALELRAFAAARGGDLWADVRRQLSSEAARRGGTATEREGRWGTELDCDLQITTPEGKVGRQQQRVIGINGSRWFLRATMVGKPAVDKDAAAPFEEVVERLFVRRGTGAMAPGEALPMTIPAQARRLP